MRSIKALIAAGYKLMTYERGEGLSVLLAPEGRKFHFFNPRFQITIVQALDYIEDDVDNCRAFIVFPTSAIEGDVFPFVVLSPEEFYELRSAARAVRDSESAVRLAQKNLVAAEDAGKRLYALLV